MLKNPDGLLSLGEAARMAGVSASTLRRDGDDGLVAMKKTVNRSREWRWFELGEIEKYKKLRAVR